MSNKYASEFSRDSLICLMFTEEYIMKFFQIFQLFHQNHYVSLYNNKDLNSLISLIVLFFVGINCTMIFFWNRSLNYKSGNNSPNKYSSDVLPFFHQNKIETFHEDKFLIVGAILNYLLINSIRNDVKHIMLKTRDVLEKWYTSLNNYWIGFLWSTLM